MSLDRKKTPIFSVNFSISYYSVSFRRFPKWIYTCNSVNSKVFNITNSFVLVLAWIRETKHVLMKWTKKISRDHNVLYLNSCSVLWTYLNWSFCLSFNVNWIIDISIPVGYLLHTYVWMTISIHSRRAILITWFPLCFYICINHFLSASIILYRPIVCYILPRTR